MTVAPNYQKADYRPAPGSGGARVAPIYNALDYRPGFTFTHASGKGGKKAKKAKIWHYSRRIAPGGHDPWGGHH